MARVEISSSDFRGRMGAIFDRADRGEQIIIRRRDKTSYTLTPVHDDDERGERGEGGEDEELTPSQIAFIDRGLNNIREGKTRRFTLEELRVKMGL